MNLVTMGSMSSVAKTFNYILYRCKLSVNTFYAPNAHNVCKHRIISSFTATLHDDVVVVLKGAFVQSIIFEREAPQFLSGAELSEFELLTVLCTM